MPRRTGQQEVANSIRPTTSERPPRPVQRSSKDRELNELRARVTMLEEAVVAAWELWTDSITNPSYRAYCAEALGETVDEIVARRPDVLNQP
jgi:hypothetical protein